MEFIKNYNQLATTAQRKIVLELINQGLNAIQPQKVLAEDFTLQENTLNVHESTFNLDNFERLHLVGFGKGSAEVCRIIEQTLGNKLTQGFAIDVVGPKPFQKVDYTKGTHPLPSQENFDFTKNVLDRLSNLTEKDMVIIVICGGGSVLFEDPLSVSLEKLQTVVTELLKSGATISEMNVIRKHLSKVKGGGFAKHLYPATVASLIFSDVPGNDLSVIASGPTVKDTTTMDDVNAILEKYQITDVPNSAFGDTPQEDIYFENVSNILMVSNNTALQAMKQKAQSQGFDVTIYSDKFQGDAKTVWQKLLENAKPGQVMLVGGETTVKVKGNGKGGRNQTLVLASLSHLEHDTIIASVGTDGWDFTTLAGAIGDSQTIEKVKELGLSTKEYLDNDDSLTFWQQVGDGIDTGHLDSNVSDVIIVWKKL